MSRHGYRYVGYGGLVRDMAASEYNNYPERHSVEISTPVQPVVYPPLQPANMINDVPARVLRAVEDELRNEVDLAMDMVDKMVGFYKTFLKAREYGKITGNCNINIVSADNPNAVPHFEIAIKAVLPDK